MKRNICRIAGFLLILVMVMLKLNDVMAFKYKDGISQMEHYYELEEGTVDVLVLGSSHAFVDVNPAILYEEYGIAAYNLCASMQPMWNTYYYLKEALKYQRPDVIVLDVYRLVEPFPYSKESKLVKSTYGMRLSVNKYEAVKASLSEEEQGNVYVYMLEFPSYHSRYMELSEEDFHRNTLFDESYKGAHYLSEVTEMERPDLNHITEKAAIESKTMEYFEKILELAKQNEIPVFLINAPYIMSEDDKKIFNTLDEYLEQQTRYDNVRYVDFNMMYDEIGIDFEKDFADYDHLNVNGLEKFNYILGSELTQNYSLTDRRGDVAFDSYEKCAKEWRLFLENSSDI